MKPQFIRMKAFGSYRDERIDFSKVQQGLFLITGDTGAGKTTIFDAIMLPFTERRAEDVGTAR